MNSAGSDDVSTPLRAAIERSWDQWGDRASLMGDLSFEAAMSRADHGELHAALPRLWELAVPRTAPAEWGAAIADRLTAAGWSQWPSPDRHIVNAVIDAWWESELVLEPAVRAAHDVLAGLVRSERPLIGFQQRWLNEFDGPGARHLARMVIDGLSSPLWANQADRQGQMLSWARSEPVVIGLTVVGGIHLEPGELSAALDVLL